MIEYLKWHGWGRRLLSVVCLFRGHLVCDGEIEYGPMGESYRITEDTCFFCLMYGNETDLEAYPLIDRIKDWLGR